jgi:hypothetical protein
LVEHYINKILLFINCSICIYRPVPRLSGWLGMFGE